MPQTYIPTIFEDSPKKRVRKRDKRHKGHRSTSYGIPFSMKEALMALQVGQYFIIDDHTLRWSAHKTAQRIRWSGEIPGFTIRANRVKKTEKLKVTRVE